MKTLAICLLSPAAIYLVWKSFSVRRTFGRQQANRDFMLRGYASLAAALACIVSDHLTASLVLAVCAVVYGGMSYHIRHRALTTISSAQELLTSLEREVAPGDRGLRNLLRKCRFHLDLAAVNCDNGAYVLGHDIAVRVSRKLASVSRQESYL